VTPTDRSALALALALLLGPGAASALDAPTLKTPQSGGTLYDTTPTFSWTSVVDATWYRVWLSRGSAGPNVLPCAFRGGAVDPSGCWVQGPPLVEVTSPLPLGAYTIWVLAWAPSGATWSVATPFTVAERFEDRRYTVFDRQTGLEWEKKDDDGGIHEKDTTYGWSVTGTGPDGSAFIPFLSTLNTFPCNTESDGFLSGAADCPGRGHRDWRLPTLDELRSIVDCSFGSTCLDPVFGPTRTGSHWTSSTSSSDATSAWSVRFSDGSVFAITKHAFLHVRAVRGGL
jgi:hypothetical protein